MARIRSVKPEFWSDRRLATRVSRDARLLYVALWNFADEHGRLHGDARYVKGNCLPYDDDITLADIERLLTELERAGRIRRYDDGGDPYIYLPKLAEHQRLEPGKVPSRLPEPPTDPYPTQPEPETSGSSGSHAGADQPAPDPDEPARGTDESSLLYVAGGREQVAGGRDVAPTKSPRAARTPDCVWDALLAACGVDSKTVTASSRGAYNRAVADLRAVDATPDQIVTRAENFRIKWPDVSLTPTALARRWAECEHSPPPRLPKTDQRVRAGLTLAEQLRAEGR